MAKKISEEKLKLIVDNYYNEAFFNLIAEYADRLDTLQKEREIEKRRYEFISLVSHQLRTPISALKLILEVASRDIKDRDLAEGLEEKINNINSLVNDLLFFLSESGTEKKEGGVKFSISKIIADETRSLKKKISKKEISVKFKKPNFKAFACGDRQRAAKVVHSLLDNAISYGRERGSVKISVSRAGKNFLKISIKDDGFGIPEKEQKKVFENFFRASNASLGKNEGSGVNLYVAKKIVESWGGKINFKSEENGGSLFYFTIPSKCPRV